MTFPTKARLTETDIRRLVRGANPDERSTAAHKLCRSMERVALSEDDRAAAQDIIRVLASDAAEQVRRALAVTLKSSRLVPPDVAARLARDVESVALPILNWSPVITDQDLIAVLRGGSKAKQVAIARRPRVTSDVAAVIVSECCEAAVQAVCANDNAQLGVRALDTAIERFSQSDDVASAIANRRSLPPSVKEKLLALVSDDMRRRLLAAHALRPDVAADLAAAARERATVDVIDQAVVSEDLVELVGHLARERRLSPSLLLRAVGRGQMAFFEHAIAELAGVAHHRTWLMIHDAGPLGLRAIYDRAGLPSRLFPAFRAAVDAFRSLQFEGGHGNLERFQERMIQRFLTAQPFAPREDVAYLLERLDRPDLGWAPHANAA